MAQGLSPFVIGTRLTLPSGPLAMPPVEVRPGAVARSVLVSAFALNPQLRNVTPATADALISGSPSVPLSSTLSLGLAMTVGPTARVTGSIGGFYMFRPKVGDRNVGLMSLAQIYFPPMAWQLIDADESVLFKQERWVDVTQWLSRKPDGSKRLDHLVTHLPIVQPHRVNNDDDWVELLGDEACFIVESDNAIPASWTSLDGS